MPKDVTLETEAVYADSSDVAAELLKPDNYFTNDTVPSLSRVEKFLRQAEEIIDINTRAAWRKRQRTNEYISARPNQQRNNSTGFKFKLQRNNVKDLDSDEGDALYVWNGSSYINYLSTKTEGRGNDYWLDYDSGYLYISSMSLNILEKVIKISYRYGDTTVPLDITEATAKLVAIKILTNENSSFILEDGGNTQTMTYDPRISNMIATVKRIIASYSNNMFTL